MPFLMVVEKAVILLCGDISIIILEINLHGNLILYKVWLFLTK